MVLCLVCRVVAGVEGARDGGVPVGGGGGHRPGNDRETIALVTALDSAY